MLHVKQEVRSSGKTVLETVLQSDVEREVLMEVGAIGFFGLGCVCMVLFLGCVYVCTYMFGDGDGDGRGQASSVGWRVVSGAT